jgi:beta-lactam-binding protein with PASTA domain
MRFLLGVLLGYSIRGKKKPLITVLTTIAFIVYIVVPTVALLALRLDVQRERQMRPSQVQVPVLKGLSCEDAETTLRASNLNLRVLATRSDLPIQPGMVIDQTPQAGEKVDPGYSIAVTVTKAPPIGDSREATSSRLSSTNRDRTENHKVLLYFCIFTL